MNIALVPNVLPEKRKQAARAGAGRPSTYSEETANYICEQLMLGRSLIKICNEEGMPDRVTVIHWLEKHADFASHYARARQSQADFMDDMIISEAENATAETANLARVRIGAYEWRASRLNPSRYGDRVLQEHTGKDGGPIELQAVTDEHRAKAVASVLRSGVTVKT